MKGFKKIVSVLCICTVMLSGLYVVSNAGAVKDVDYTIKNPYADVNWEKTNQYKADLHSHTTSSDGNGTLKEMIESHYDYDFDILAVTDHGINSISWTEEHVNPVLSTFIKLFKNRGGRIEVLNKNGGFTAKGDKYGLVTRDGADYYYQISANDGTAGHEMMRVPFGIENNPVSINNAHVNSWFVPYGEDVLGGTSDYITPISNIDKLGGLSVINHPGEYSGARDVVYSKDAYSYNSIKFRYIIDKFAGLLTQYNSCIGIDVNSKGDDRTRFDRKLWDILLQRVVPTGRNVFGLATSDAHSVDVTYSGYTEICMEKCTVENLKNSLSKGQFFACSKYIGNYDEITEIGNLLVKQNKSPESKALGQTLQSLSKEGEVNLANGDKCPKYKAPFSVEAPVIKGVKVDDVNDTITITADENAYLIRWIADGRTIATGDTICLDDYSRDIGSYVRAEVFGEGGVVYVQPFTLSYAGAPAPQLNDYIDLGWVYGLIPDTILNFINKLPGFDIIWNLIKNK